MNGNRLPRFRPRTRRRLVALTLTAVAVGGLAVAWLETSAPAPSHAGRSASRDRTSAAAARTDAKRSTDPAPKSTSPTSAKGATTQVPPLGVYAGPGNAAGAEAVASQLGGRVPYALDFLPRTSWTALDDPTWVARQWHGTPFDLVIGVPMLPNTGATLAQGAAGAFDGEFRTLAERLVQDGLGDAILMLGYQPDDAGTPWYVGSAAAAAEYVRYWRAIRSTMVAVPGAQFLFEWDAGDAGTSPESPTAMYPGNRAVDIVATDAFDLVPWKPSTHGHWSTVLNETYGPAWMASFANVHHKQMAIAMWGEVPVSDGGGGDQGAYVTDLLRWAAAQHLDMCVLWDYEAMSLTGGNFPAAAAALHQAVASGAGTSGA
jgi:hypothetical protein